MIHTYYELRCGNEVLDRSRDPDALDWNWAYEHGYSEEDLEVVQREYTDYEVMEVQYDERVV